ncbi:MAG: autotransporter domain-containing protein, partial [Methylobacterium sp.]|nr:autotransporter domain-containing protein [Methylobacterium sp.]
GGSGPTAGSAGSNGVGGAGVTGSGVMVINGGSILGGSGANGRANAITFTGGTNSLELRAGSSITGQVVGTGSDSFRLGGDANSAFDISAVGGQYTGFSQFTKIGSSTWTLTGANGSFSGFTVSSGVLVAGSATSFGENATVRVNGGEINAGGLAGVRLNRIEQNGGNLDNGRFDVTTYRIGNGTMSAGGGVNASGAFEITGGVVNGRLSGAGRLTKSGLADAQLGGGNSHTGGTLVQEGRLSLGHDRALGDEAGTTEVTGGTLQLGSAGSSYNLRQDMLRQTGGTVQLGKITVSTYSMTGGTLRNDATVTGTSMFALEGGLVQGVLAGSGRLHKTTAGTVTLSGANTFSGSTQIDAGTLVLGHGSGLGSATGTTKVTGGLLDLGSQSATQSQLVQTGGSIGRGSMTLTNYWMDGGTLNADATLTASTFDIRSGTVNGLLAGHGALNKSGSGVGLLVGRSSYVGATQIAEGTLRAGAENSFSRASATSVATGGTLDLNGYAQSINQVSLMGGLLTGGNATTSLTGAITSAGGEIRNLGGLPTLTLQSGLTVLSGVNTLGRVTVASGSTLLNNGISSDDLVNAGTFINNGIYTANIASNTGTITNLLGSTWIGDVQSNTGIIQNAGTLQGAVTNSGSFTNTGTITGPVGLTGGTFTNNGTLQGPVTISGGTIMGGGVLGNLSVGSGTINGTGMTLTGDLSLTSASTFQQSVGLPEMRVGGTAALAGSAALTLTQGTPLARQYRVLTAGAVSGRFDSVSLAHFPSHVRGTLGYGQTEVFLDLHSALAQSAGITPNQAGVASSLDAAFNAGTPLPAALQSVYASDLPQASLLHHLTPEAATGAQSSAFATMNHFIALFGRGAVVANRTGAQVPVSGEITRPRWTIWGAGFGGLERRLGQAATGSHTHTGHSAGLAAGANWRDPGGISVGFSMAGASMGWTTGASLGSGTADAFLLGGYVEKEFGRAYLRSSAALGQFGFNTRRSALGATLNSEMAGQGYAGRVEAGYALGFGFTPFVALQGQALRTPANVEADPSGSGLALAFSSRAVTELRTEAGLRFEHTVLANGGMPILLSGSISAIRSTGSGASVRSGFVALPGATFVTTGARSAREAARISVGVQGQITRAMSLSASIDGEFAARSRS